MGPRSHWDEDAERGIVCRMSRSAGPAYLVIVIVGLAVMWLAMGLLGLAIEVPAKAIMAWLVEAAGPWGPAGFMVVGFGALAVAARASHRRDQRRQFETDRTIHVEKPPNRKGPLLALAVIWGGGILVALAGVFPPGVNVVVVLALLFGSMLFLKRKADQRAG